MIRMLEINSEISIHDAASYTKYPESLSGDHLLKITQGRSLKVDHRFALHHLCVRALLAYPHLFLLRYVRLAS